MLGLFLVVAGLLAVVHRSRRNDRAFDRREIEFFRRLSEQIRRDQIHPFE